MAYTHGKVSTYNYYKCRCTLCTKARTDYGKKMTALHPISEETKLRYYANARVRSKESQVKRRAFIHILKSVPCADCGKSYPPFVMDFDHVPGRGTKKFEISRWASETHRLDSKEIQEELAKCDVVCSNCHRFRTHSQLESRQHKP